MICRFSEEKVTVIRAYFLIMQNAYIFLKKVLTDAKEVSIIKHVAGEHGAPKRHYPGVAQFW